MHLKTQPFALKGYKGWKAYRSRLPINMIFVKYNYNTDEIILTKEYLTDIIIYVGIGV